MKSSLTFLTAYSLAILCAACVALATVDGHISMPKEGSTVVPAKNTIASLKGQ